MLKRAYPVGTQLGSRDYQLLSKFNASSPYRTTGGLIVAEIFFGVDEHILRKDDMDAIEALAEHYLKELQRGNKISLLCAGRADETYKEKHNQELSEKRAREVLMQIRKKVGLKKDFQVADTGPAGPLSTGERYLTVDRAYDRRVDVYEAFNKIGPELQRLVSTEYLEFKTKMSSGPVDKRALAGEALGMFWDGLHMILTSKKFKPPGSEQKEKRKYESIPALYRVNKVKIDTKTKARFVLGGRTETTKSKLDYQWGPPTDSVTVHVSEEGWVKSDGPRTETVQIPRKEVDESPFLMPPLKAGQ